VSGLRASFEAYGTIQQMRQTLSDDQAKMPQDTSLNAASEAFDEKAAMLVEGNSGFGIANRDLARRLQDLDFGDMRPTASNMAAINQGCHQKQESAVQWDHLRQQDLPALNHMLAAAHLPQLNPPADPQITGSGH